MCGTLESLDPLRQAAVTLLTAAPHGAVILAVRALLDGWEQGQPLAPAAEPQQAARRAEGMNAAVVPAVPPAAAVAPPRGTVATKPQALVPNDTDTAAWMPLRQQLRDAREARGLTVRALADELGVPLMTLRFVLYSRQPPSKSLQKRLTDWLATAPEVAAGLAEPFRPNGAGHSLETNDDADRLAA
jgi:hypothetical protein